MKIDTILGIVVYMVVIIFAVSFSYGLALIHHPVAVWLWHDILGVI